MSIKPDEEFDRVHESVQKLRSKLTKQPSKPSGELHEQLDFYKRMYGVTDPDFIPQMLKLFTGMAQRVIGEIPEDFEANRWRYHGELLGIYSERWESSQRLQELTQPPAENSGEKHVHDDFCLNYGKCSE